LEAGMSRSVTGGSGLYTASVPVSSNTFTVAGWFYCTSVPSDNRAIWSFGDDTDSNYQALLIRGSQSGALRQYDQVYAGFGGDPTGNVMIANAWQHFAVVGSGNSSRRVVLNGDWANSSAGTDTFTWYAEQFYLGVAGANEQAQDFFLTGLLAHVAVWNSALSQAQVEGLAGPFTSGSQSGSGDNPLAVQTANLVAYWPLVGTASPEPDDQGSYDLTLLSSPTQGASDPTVDAPPSGQSNAPRAVHLMKLMGA
jgi:hypothetical protein